MAAVGLQNTTDSATVTSVDSDEENDKPTTDNPIIDAVMENDLQKLKELLVSHGEYLDAMWTSGGFNALHAACRKGQVEMVKCLVEAGADIFKRTQHSRDSAMHIACDASNVEIVRYLIDKGADINALQLHRSTPLRVACIRGNPMIVEVLIKEGADIDLAERTGRTPLITAAEKGHAEVTRLLLEAGCNKDAGDCLRRTAVYHASHHRHPQVLRYLIQYGANINTVDRRGVSPLHMLCRIGFYDMMQILLDAGCDRDILGQMGGKNGATYTPIWEAVQDGHLLAVKMLLDAGANPDRGDEGSIGNSLFALMMSNHIRVDILRALLEAGVNVNYRNINGYSPLHFATDKGWLPVINILLQADLDIQSEVPWIVTFLEQPDVEPEIRQILEWAVFLASVPRALLWQCRRQIRRCLAHTRPVDKPIKSLPLPPALKNVLLYRDLHLEQ